MAIDDEVSETTNRRPLLSGLKGLGCGLLILALVLALMFVFRTFWHQGRMASKLQETLAELDRTDPGWRLEEIEAARIEVPEEGNSARVVVAAAKQMPQRWPSADFPEQNLQSVPPNEMLSGEDFVRLSSELASVRVAVANAGKLADMPRGRHRIHYERNPIMTLLPDQQETRRIASLLVYEAMRLSQKGESKKALIACRAALNAARSLGDEPIYISQLIRIACIALACQAIERTLAQGEPPTEDLRDLQKLLEDEDTFPGLLVATRGERATMQQVFEAIERGEFSLSDLEGLTRSGGQSDQMEWLKNTALSLWRMDTREDNVLFLYLMTKYLRAAQLPTHEQAERERGFEVEVRALPANAIVTRMLLPALTKVAGAFRRKHASVRCTMAALAAERYRREKKTWPDSLEQLCPQFLAEVPTDPFDGVPLRYRRLKDGVVIYSVGQDLADNGGTIDPERRTLTGVDIVFRLWDVAKRRQPSRPKPPPEGPMGGSAVAPPPNPK